MEVIMYRYNIFSNIDCDTLKQTVAKIGKLLSICLLFLGIFVFTISEPLLANQQEALARYEEKPYATIPTGCTI